MMAYIIKSGLMLSLFGLFFILVMKRTTFFRFNRMMLMAGSFICLLLPLFDISFMPDTVVSSMPHLEIPDSSALRDMSGDSREWNWMSVLSVIYFAGVMTTAAFCVMSIFRTLAVCRKGDIVRRDGISITVTNDPMASFSFFRNIVISREDYEQNPIVLQHEMMHVKCHHSVDVVLFSFITALHWFNPLVWMTRKELKEVQEYEADEAVLKQGIDATQYQLLLVKKAVGAERFQMANGFNHTKLKNRIAMMQSAKTAATAKLAYLACLPLLLSVLCFCSNSSPEPISYRMLDETATFNGDDPHAFSMWMKEQLSFSEIAGISEINGRVTASFTVDKRGEVVNPKIVKGLSDDVDREVLRILSSSPEWAPAKYNGRAVTCTFTFPIVFNAQ